MVIKITSYWRTNILPHLPKIIVILVPDIDFVGIKSEEDTNLSILMSYHSMRRLVKKQDLMMGLPEWPARPSHGFPLPDAQWHRLKHPASDHGAPILNGQLLLLL